MRPEDPPAMRLKRALFIAPVLAATLLAALLLAASGPARVARNTADPPLSATPPSSPMATPTPLPPPPLSVPQGWQVYRAHHFALAYPPGWMAREDVTYPDGGGVTAASISFNSPDGTRAVVVSETEGLGADDLRQVCARPGTRTTYAGLPVISTRTAYTLRSNVFAASDGVVYTLLYEEVHSSAETQALYNQILRTFRPEYTTPACQ